MDSPTKPPERDLPNQQGAVSVVHITDPTAVGESVELLDQDVVSLGAREFAAKRVTVPLEKCGLMYQWTNARLRSRTKVHEGFDACTVLGPNAHGSLDGAELRPFSLIAAGCGALGEIIVDSGYESVTLLLPPQLLEQQLTVRGQCQDFEIPAGPVVWRPDSAIARELFELGESIVNAAEKTPAIFNDSHLARYGAQVEFTDALAATIESCGPDESVDADKKGMSYSQVVKTCEDYVMKIDGHRPYMSELCSIANVSERTLQYAFRDIMGMSPVTYLRRLRLHRARNELRVTSSRNTTVTDVAMNWGFWHFGAFSQAYKNCFGELPSRTLKKGGKD